jgi:hypothetical protein
VRGRAWRCVRFAASPQRGSLARSFKLKPKSVEWDSPGADFTSDGFVRVVFAGGADPQLDKAVELATQPPR